MQATRGRWPFPKRLACLARPAWRRQGGGALVFQDLGLVEALSAEAKPRPIEVEEGEVSPKAESFGKREPKR